MICVTLMLSTEAEYCVLLMILRASRVSMPCRVFSPRAKEIKEITRGM